MMYIVVTNWAAMEVVSAKTALNAALVLGLLPQLKFQLAEPRSCPQPGSRAEAVLPGQALHSGLSGQA